MNKPRIFRYTTLTLFLTGLVIILTAGTAAFSTWAAAPSAGTNTAYFPIFPGRPTTTTDVMYGINFISSAEAPADSQMYQNGLSLDPEWNRYPLYWPMVETSQDVFNWTRQDVAVQGDIAHNLKTNAILLGTPEFYMTGAPQFGPDTPLPRGGIHLRAPETATPEGLYEPVFNDGTDIPGPNKTINPANFWARYVSLAVNRYKPGGILAQANGWPQGVGVTHWEIWNEPDLNTFWNGTIADYARLLKVGFLAVHHADLNAVVLFGGLANFQIPAFYDTVLDIYDSDPLAPVFGYFHNILATHNYSYAFYTWYYVARGRTVQHNHGFTKPIWLNETGVPAWDDYPGPVWVPDSPYRATMAEQADFLVQSTFYAVYGGAEAIFRFQLYDGCGNQPPGTDFPPHNGELCDENGRLITNPDYPCAGDANGLFTNPTDAVCFSQHPQPETPRPSAVTYKMLANTLDNVEPYWWVRRSSGDQNSDSMEWIAFYQPETKKRIIGLWTRFGEDQTAELPATGNSALLLFPDGTSQTIVPVDGSYLIQLPGATNQNAPWDPTLYMIGGRPVIVIEDDLTRAGPPPPP